VPVSNDVRLPAIGTSVVKTVYQADWLMRFMALKPMKFSKKKSISRFRSRPKNGLGVAKHHNFQ
jgi:predicted DNA-binding helix-hairpin-helix protein